MLGYMQFNETPPSSAGTAASSGTIAGNSANYLAAGIAGPLDDYQAINLIAEFTPNVGGSLNVYLQSSPDNGVSWYDMVAWPTQGGGSSTSPVVYYSSPLSLATNTGVTASVGKNTSPALSPGSNGAVINGAWGDRVRLIMVSGSGTSKSGNVIVKCAPTRTRTSDPG
jgi:hypothetical protein